MPTPTIAFGAPGNPPRWTPSTKNGIGTAYHTSCRLWFTLSHGIVNEIYFPHVDSPNTRDLQFLITDGETFCHEERRDLEQLIEYPELNSLLYRLTNSARDGRYRLIKEIMAEPHSSVLLMRVRLEIIDPKLRGKLRLYALLAPHIKGWGWNNSAEWCELDGQKFLTAWRENIHLVCGGIPGFLRRSVGYVGHSDGWQDLMDNFKMDWEFTRAENGNLALMGEMDLSGGLEFTLGVAFGFSRQSAAAQLLQALATPFDELRQNFVKQWRRAQPESDWAAHTHDDGSMFRLSHCLLLAHEDKIFQGGFVASLSIPWGETRSESNPGGYHLVWTRDMVHTATALLASGHNESALRALIWLACVQHADGSMPQNSWINGEHYWPGTQLDEVAAPILLAWRAKEAGALRQFDPWPLVSRAARFLVANGPVTAQERWEEASGYSPSTLAAIIAALVCAAEFAREREKAPTADFLLAYADWLAAHVEAWTVTTCGELLPGKSRHYIRITPADPDNPAAHPDSDHAELSIVNGGGRHPARNVVSGDFLQLVRLGVRDAQDPLIIDSLAVIDAVIKRDLPQGPGWRRYNFDGYGQQADGRAFVSRGEGRCWPLLTGERGHYELAAGRDPLPFIAAMEAFANDGGMLPEQVWDADDLPSGKMKRGGPTGSAMPLCWAHSEYMTLVRSSHDGRCFDRPEPVYQRYAKERTGSQFEIWTFAHQPQRIAKGKTLRIITEAAAKVHWSCDEWATATDTETQETGLGCWFADLPMPNLRAGARVRFTFLWKDGWEGKDFSLAIENSVPAEGKG
jgi:glucoamylase